MKNHVKRLAGTTIVGTVAVGSLLAFAPAANGVETQTQMTGKIVYNNSSEGSSGYYGITDENETAHQAYGGVVAARGTAAEARAGASVLTFPRPGSTGRITNAAGQCLYYSKFQAEDLPSNPAPGHVKGKVKWVACSSATELSNASSQWTWKSGRIITPSVSFASKNGRTYYAALGGVPGKPDYIKAVMVFPEEGDTPSFSGIAPLTAEVTSKDQSAKTAVISGTGEPGATIKLSGPWGDKTVQVGNDGRWTTPISGLVDGSNPVNVKQVIDSKGYGEENLTVDFEKQTAPLTAKLDSSDSAAKTAVISGTGEPGATIDLSGDWGTAQVKVGPDGTWRTTIGGLKDGENDVHVTQTVGDKPAGEADLKVTFEASPIVNPAVAGGTTIAALVAGAFVAIRRRMASD